MLDDLAVGVDAEDVDAGVVVVAGPALVAMEDDEVAFGDRTLELDALARILARHLLEVVDERLLAVGDVRVVLDVLGARVALDRLARTAVVEHQLVERPGVALVALEPVVHD